MRSRLTLGFSLLAFVLLACFTGVRLFALHDLIRDREGAHLQHEASVLARTLDAWTRRDQPLDATTLRALVNADTRATVDLPGQGRLTAAGSAYGGAGQGLTARASSGQVEVRLVQSTDVVRSVARASARPVVALFLALVLLAGLIGYVFAIWFTRPFGRLALAASALGRGRFDLDLPRSRVSEVRQLVAALQASAGQLEHDLAADQQFLTEASHNLRTPITGLRLELEELQLELPPGHPDREAVDLCLTELRRLDAVVDEVMSGARTRWAARGARVPLQQVAQQVADRWSRTLEHPRVTVTGFPTVEVTPGPVEQVLERVHADLRAARARAVHLTLQPAGDHLHLSVRGEAPEAQVERPTQEQTRALVETLAGRSSGDPVSAQGLRIWLPMR